MCLTSHVLAVNLPKWIFYRLCVCRFRTFCRRLTSHVVFKGLILFFVALTCVTIAAESHNIKPESTVKYMNIDDHIQS